MKSHSQHILDHLYEAICEFIVDVQAHFADRSPTDDRPHLMALTAELDIRLKHIIGQFSNTSSFDVNLLPSSGPFAGASMLMVCCQYQCYSSVELLLQLGADLELVHMYNNTITAIQFALAPAFGVYTSTTVDILELLLLHRAYPRPYISIPYMFHFLSSGHLFDSSLFQHTKQSGEHPRPLTLLNGPYIQLLQLLLRHDHPSNLNLLQQGGTIYKTVFSYLYSVAATSSAPQSQHGRPQLPTSTQGSPGGPALDPWEHMIDQFLSTPHGADFQTVYDLLFETTLAYYGLLLSSNPLSTLYIMILQLAQIPRISLAFLRRQLVRLFDIPSAALTNVRLDPHYHCEAVESGFPSLFDIYQYLSQSQMLSGVLRPGQPLELLHNTILSNQPHYHDWFELFNFIRVLFCQDGDEYSPSFVFPNDAKTPPELVIGLYSSHRRAKAFPQLYSFQSFAFTQPPQSKTDGKYLEYIKTLAVQFNCPQTRHPPSVERFMIPSAWQQFYSNDSPNMLLYYSFHPSPYRHHPSVSTSSVEPHSSVTIEVWRNTQSYSYGGPLTKQHMGDITLTAASQQEQDMSAMTPPPQGVQVKPFPTHSSLMQVLSSGQLSIVNSTAIDRKITTKRRQFHPPPSSLLQFLTGRPSLQSDAGTPSLILRQKPGASIDPALRSSLPPSFYGRRYAPIPELTLKNELAVFNFCQYLLSQHLYSIFEFYVFDNNLPYLSQETLTFLLTSSAEYLEYYRYCVEHLPSVNTRDDAFAAALPKHTLASLKQIASADHLHRRYTLSMLLSRFKLVTSPHLIDLLLEHLFLPLFSQVHQVYLDVLGHPDEKRYNTSDSLPASLVASIQTEAAYFLQQLYTDDSVPLVWCYRVQPYLQNVSFFQGHVPMISSRLNWVKSRLFVQKLYMLFYLRFRHIVDPHTTMDQVGFKSFSNSPTWKFRHKSGQQIIHSFLQFSQLDTPSSHQLYHLFTDHILPHSDIPFHASPETQFVLNPSAFIQSQSHLESTSYTFALPPPITAPFIVQKLFSSLYASKTFHDHIALFNMLMTSRSAVPQPGLSPSVIALPSASSDHATTLKPTDVVLVRSNVQYRSKKPHVQPTEHSFQSYLPSGAISIINTADYHGQDLNYNYNETSIPASINVPFYMQFLSTFSIYLIHTSLYRVFKTSAVHWFLNTVSEQPNGRPGDPNVTHAATPGVLQSLVSWIISPILRSKRVTTKGNHVHPSVALYASLVDNQLQGFPKRFLPTSRYSMTSENYSNRSEERCMHEELRDLHEVLNDTHLPHLTSFDRTTDPHFNIPYLGISPMYVYAPYYLEHYQMLKNAHNESQTTLDFKPPDGIHPGFKELLGVIFFTFTHSVFHTTFHHDLFHLYNQPSFTDSSPHDDSYLPPSHHHEQVYHDRLAIINDVVSLAQQTYGYVYQPTTATAPQEISSRRVNGLQKVNDQGVGCLPSAPPLPLPRQPQRLEATDHVEFTHNHQSDIDVDDDLPPLEPIDMNDAEIGHRYMLMAQMTRNASKEHAILKRYSNMSTHGHRAQHLKAMRRHHQHVQALAMQAINHPAPIDIQRTSPNLMGGESPPPPPLRFTKIHQHFGISPLELEEQRRLYRDQLLLLFNIYVADVFDIRSTSQHSTDPSSQEVNNTTCAHPDHVSRLIPRPVDVIPVKFNLNITSYLTTTCEVNAPLLRLLSGMQFDYHQNEVFNPFTTSHSHQSLITRSPSHQQHHLYCQMVAHPLAFADKSNFPNHASATWGSSLSLSRDTSPHFDSHTHRFDIFNFNVIDVVLHIQEHFQHLITLSIYDNEEQHIWHLLLLTYITTLHPFLPLTTRDVRLVEFLIEKVNYDRALHRSSLSSEKYFRYYYSESDRTILSRRFFKLPINSHSITILSLLYQHNILSPLEQNLYDALLSSQTTGERSLATLAPPVIEHYIRSLFIPSPSESDFDLDTISASQQQQGKAFFTFSYNPVQTNHAISTETDGDGGDDDDDDNQLQTKYHAVASILRSGKGKKVVIDKLQQEQYFHHTLATNFTFHLPIRQASTDLLLTLTAIVLKGIKREMNVLNINHDVDPHRPTLSSPGLALNTAEVTQSPFTPSSLFSLSSHNMTSSVLLQFSKLSALFSSVLHGRPMVSIGASTRGSIHGVNSQSFFHFLSFYIRELCYSMSADQFLACFQISHNHFHYTTSHATSLIKLVWPKLGAHPALPQYFETNRKLLGDHIGSFIDDNIGALHQTTAFEQLRRQNPSLYSFILTPLLQIGARVSASVSNVLDYLIAMGFNIHHFPSKTDDPDVWRNLLVRTTDPLGADPSQPRPSVGAKPLQRYLDIYLMQDYLEEQLYYLALCTSVRMGNFVFRIQDLLFKAISSPSGNPHGSSPVRPHSLLLASGLDTLMATTKSHEHLSQMMVDRQGRSLSMLLFYNIFNTPYFLSKDMYLDTTQNLTSTAIALPTLPLVHCYSSPMMALLNHPSVTLRNAIFTRYAAYQNPALLASIQSWSDFVTLRIHFLESMALNGEEGHGTTTMRLHQRQHIDIYDDQYKPSDSLEHVDELAFDETIFEVQKHPFSLDLIALQEDLRHEMMANPHLYTQSDIYHNSLLIYIMNTVHNPTADDIMSLLIGCYDDHGRQICSPILEVPPYQAFQTISSDAFSIIDSQMDPHPDGNNQRPMADRNVTHQSTISSALSQQESQLITVASLMQIFTMAILRRWDENMLLFVLNTIGIDNIIHFAYNYQLYHHNRQEQDPSEEEMDETDGGSTTEARPSMSWKWSLMDFLHYANTKDYAPGIVKMIEDEFYNYNVAQHREIHVALPSTKPQWKGKQNMI